MKTPTPRFIRFLNDIWRDAEYAGRVLRKDRSYSLTALFVLTLGISSTVSVFTILDTVVFRPLPFPDGDQLFQLRLIAQERMATPYPEEYEGWTALAEASGVEAVSAVVPSRIQPSGVSAPELLDGAAVAANFFDLVGIKPMLGRAFTPEEDRPGGTPVVVLSHGVWQRLYHGDRAVLGRTLLLKDDMVPEAATIPYTIIGVMPLGFRFPDSELKFLIPFNQDPIRIGLVRPLPVYVRLRTGVPVEQAIHSLTSVSENLAQEQPFLYKDRSVRLISLHQMVTGVTGRLPLVLLAAVGFALLIAAVNVANLTLGHAASRSREIAIRLSLGAKRSRILRQMLTESLMLAAAGGALGLMSASGLVRVIVTLLPENVPRITEITVDWRVTGFALVVSMFAGVVSGLYPAWYASRQPLSESLRRETPWTRGWGSSTRVRWVLTVIEVTLAVTLCAGAGLLLKSLMAVSRVSLGFDPNNVVTFHLQGSFDQVRNEEARAAQVLWLRELAEVLSRVPGVTDAATSIYVPLKPTPRGGTFAFVSDSGEIGESFHAKPHEVTPGFQNVVGLRLLQGRFLNREDLQSGLPVLVVSRLFAGRTWPGQNAVGKTLMMRTGPGFIRHTVIGVVEDMKITEDERQWRSVFDYVEGEVYIPLTSAPNPNFQFALVRTASDPRPMVPALKRAIWSADPNQAIRTVDLLQDLVDRELAEPRFRLLLLGSFGVIALVIATIGIYGVVSHAVISRVHEMGVRVALGARRRDILRLILGESLASVLIGVFLGVMGAFALTGLIQSFLFGTEPFDAMTYGSVAALFVVAALVASWPPAHFASRVDPIQTLRCE